MISALLMSAQGCFIFPRSSAPVPKTAAQKRAEAADSAERAAGLKPYAKVIPTRARTTNGLFRTHCAGDTLYFEIPRHELNKDMLLVTADGSELLSDYADTDRLLLIQ